MGTSSSPTRRTLLGTGLIGVMWAALVGSYGFFASTAVRFLFPSRRGDGNWTYVSDLGSFGVGTARDYEAPDGARITIARQGTGETPEDFIALSSVCPHLGCQVHWESQNDRFFCPCHNGVFSPDGTGVSGPPGDAGQNLPRYAVKVEGGLLYLDVPAPDGLAQSLRPVEPAGLAGPGHDPCLMAQATRGAREHRG